MRRFWGYYDNGTYRVGCNGATVYVYDQNNRELAKFKDIPYAYAGAFQPGTNVFVVKSTEGFLAVYDLDKLELLRKSKPNREGGDEGFSFTPDGNWLYNIEHPFTSLRTQLTKYSTSDYSVPRVLFADAEQMFLEALEFDETTGIGYVLGYMRNADGIMDYGFIGKLEDDNIYGIKRLSRDEEIYLRRHKSWERSGFTEKKLEWTHLPPNPDKTPISLKEIYKKASV